MHILQAKIRVLSEHLNKRIEENDYVIDDDIIRLSQIVDNYIVKHERLKLDLKGSN